MNRDDRKTIPDAPQSTPPADNGTTTGEGAETALKALIKRRKLAEAPGAPDTQDPNDSQH
jgi:hypothetical protein